MARSRKPNPPGTGQRVSRWDYNPVPAKTSHRGWIAGKPWGAYTHFINRKSEPCSHQISEGAVPCAHCALRMVPVWRGYVPYYSDLYEPMFVVIAETHYESVEELDHLTPIMLSRGTRKTDPVVIRTPTFKTTPIPYSEHRAKPVDLSWFCIHVLWSHSELRVWDLNQPPPAPPAAPTPKTVTRVKPGDMTRAAHRLIDTADPDVPLAEVFAPMMNRVKGMEAPHQNGKPVKPKG